MSGTGPGRAAYEAFMRSLTGRCPDVPVVAWERLDDLARDGYASGDMQADWDAAAQAVSEGVRAELRELAENHDQLLEAILQNADEDINGGDEAPEYLAEQYVRFLEQQRDEASAELDRRAAAQPRELAESMRETRELRELVREICDKLVSQKYPAAKVAPWLKRAGLEG